MECSKINTISFLQPPTFKISKDKPIRLIELFAGYGSQHLALNYLGVQFESWHICEWAVKSIQAYKDLHFPEDTLDYSKELSANEVIDFLFYKGISMNYNEPMSREQITRLGEQKCRQIYNNIKASHNLVNITQTKASDLEIKDTENYTYLLTYSFPCQDLSKAGARKGMARESGTRSGMLWEVERLLEECEELPQVLLMENVPDVKEKNNIEHFTEWVYKLNELGYKNYYKILNSKDYGIPQNRRRCFMVSILGNYHYKFPKSMKLEKTVEDYLESNADKKYYLSERALKGCVNTTFEQTKLENRVAKNGCIPTLAARDYKDPKLHIDHQGQVRKLIPIEYWRLMGVKDEDFYRVARNQSNSSLYHLAGDSIVVNVLMAIIQKLL